MLIYYLLSTTKRWHQSTKLINYFDRHIYNNVSSLDYSDCRSLAIHAQPVASTCISFYSSNPNRICCMSRDIFGPVCFGLAQGFGFGIGLDPDDYVMIQRLVLMLIHWFGSAVTAVVVVKMLMVAKLSSYLCCCENCECCYSCHTFQTL